MPNPRRPIPDPRLSRRLLAATTALLLVVAACGGSDDAADEPSRSDTAVPAGTEAPDATDPATDTTAVEDTIAVGSSESTSPPETAAITEADAAPTTDPPSTEPEQDARRVVALAEEVVLADLLALGVDTVASSATVAEAGLQGLDGLETGDIEVLPMTTLSLEQLAALDPDVIVTLQFWVDQVGEDVLSDIAEVVVVPDGLSSEDRLLTLAEAFGRTDEAEELLADLDEARAGAEAAVPDDCAVSLVAIYAGPNVAAFVDGPWEIPQSVLGTGCALEPDASQTEPDQNGRAFLSLEQLGLLGAPTIVLLQNETVGGEQESVDDVTSNPIWQQLPAVQSGQVVEFDRLGYPGVLGQIRFLEEFADTVGNAE